MYSKIIFVIILNIYEISHAHIIDTPYTENDYIDQYIDYNISECVVYDKQCNPNLRTPCCEESSECQAITWNSYKSSFLCLQPALIGDSCRTDIDCLNMFDLYCNKDKKCQCTDNLVPLNSTTCGKLTSGFCLNDTDCSIENSTCINYKCECKPFFELNFDNQCVPTVLGKSCYSDYHCKDSMHFKCSNNKKCTCKENRIVINNATCAPLLDEFCWSNERCAPHNSICFNNKCQCKAHYKAISNYECKEIKFGKPCEKNKDCGNVLENFKCSDDKKCLCKENYTYIDDLCLPSLEEFCRSNERCAPDNSVCADHKCQCKPNYISVSNHTCIPNSIVQNCEINADCTLVKHAHCSENNKCVCKTDFISHDGSSCLQILSGFCSGDEHCAIENSVCINSKCECSNNTIQINGKCV
ncbi:prion-like-(Q/N-rich) domain-bearing protein 25 [Microplitis mediator]|uniref:prion-like-(Q/N-rich) domain-bearing protein 25 n=1 Tax=Microplitis mediator TaxID=375433 RepID=UPI0025546E8B|nr:prion-like-(Q/N-rich) domain-bearing protein 25 [Microplitis mediator]